jgi:tetratricopeptide (TPR) repeat protein
MFTYWLNYHLFVTDPFGYHVLNILIHAFNTALVFLILDKLLALAGWAKQRGRNVAILCSSIFLIHPLATESVSYIAGRSESLAAMFVLGAYAIFLYRRQGGISWRDAVAVVTLFGLGVAAKENAVALIGVLLLTDCMFSSGRNWRLYVLLAPGVVFAAGIVLPVLWHGGNAGFSIREFTWYQYAFTEARALFTYLRLAILPLGQSVDHDFPISHTIGQYGAWMYLAALAILIGNAIRFRRRFPLSCFGLLMFLILLAPTSSVIPIADPLVERRMYLPMIGLLLIACDAASRIRLNTPAAYSLIAAGLLFFAACTYDRNRLWGQPDQLLAAAASQSVHNPRPFANLTDVLIANRRCSEALPWLAHAERLLPNNYMIEASWGRALECVGRREEALRRLQSAAALQPTWKLFELIGLLYGEMNRLDDAREALRRAVELEPHAGSPHRSLALCHEASGDPLAAQSEYRVALNIDPHDTIARRGLARVISPVPHAPEHPLPTVGIP